MLKNIVVIVCTIAFLTSCSKKEDETKVSDVGRLVRAVEVGAGDLSLTRTFPGVVVANKKVDLAFQVAGQIIELPIAKGQDVEEGQLLAKLDQRNYRHDLESAEAELLRAKAQHGRFQELLHSDAISEAAYDEAKATYLRAIADHGVAEKAFEDTTLEAPFKGLVADKEVENFENVLAKQQILSLQDISYVDVEVNLPEQYVTQRGQISHGETVVNSVARISAIPGREFEIVLKEYVTDADPITQTYKVVVTMPAPDDVNVLPGMTADLVFRGSRDDAVFNLPVNSVATDETGNRYVWVINPESSTVTKRIVTVGELANDQIQVIDGVEVGEKIVTAGVPYLTEGMKVRIMQQE